MPCPVQQMICKIVVTFDQNVLDPICQICCPTDWTYTLGSGGVAGRDGITFQYVGGQPGCTGAIGADPLDFNLCGFNTSGPIGYLVCAYFCTNTVTGGCEPDPSPCCLPFTSTITCPTSGVASIIESKLFAVDEGFPNPAASSIRFDYTAPYQGTMSLTLVDILGKTVSMSSNIVAQGDGNVIINLTGVQAGGYYCVFEFNGERITKRIEIK